MARIFGISEFVHIYRCIKHNGGIFKSLRTMFRMDILKVGTLVGEDKFGNKYYENDLYYWGTNRWVVYSDKAGLNYDASQVPPDWFGWLHYKTDYLPHNDPYRPKYKWMLEHTPNLSGTQDAFMPYSTTKSKVEAWQPKD